jgi:hypothetical protein
MRGGNEGFGEFLRDDATRRGLMRSVEEAVEKADGNSLDAGVPQNADRVAHRSLVERSFDPPVVVQSFGHFEPQRPFDEHGGFVGLKIIKFGSFLPPDFEKVAEAVTW